MKEIALNNFYFIKLDIKSENFLPGHALALFVDGVETSSTAISYALYELGKNADIQEKLHHEVSELLDKNDGNVTGEDLQELVYLEAVLFEAMRIHTPLMVMQKICTKEYELPKNSHQSKAIKISPGMAISIPVQAIHMYDQSNIQIRVKLIFSCL